MKKFIALKLSYNLIATQIAMMIVKMMIWANVLLIVTNVKKNQESYVYRNSQKKEWFLYQILLSPQINENN